VEGSLPLLLDFLTVFFIVAGCVLLWLNLRARLRNKSSVVAMAFFFPFGELG
jgi:hypothetical protein